MIEKKYTDKQRESFQKKLAERTQKMDTFGELKKYFCGVGYFYAAGLNFGKFLKNPDSSFLISEFKEVMDNVGTEAAYDCALIFSRPGDSIYVLMGWDKEIYPSIHFRSYDLGYMQIVKLEDLLEVL